MQTRLAVMLCLVLHGPLAWCAGFTPDLATLSSVPVHALPPPVVAKDLLLAAPRKDRPYAYAQAVSAGLTQADGVWTSAGPAASSWRTRIRLAGASTLSFQLSTPRLPEGAAIWVYDHAGKIVQGPYTAAQVTPEGRVWTALVRGADAVIEAQLPSASAADFQLRIDRAYYGYADPLKAGSLGQSGACEIDVTCSQGDAWRDENRAVGLITVPQGPLLMVLCSGLLVNNVAQDNTPFFLTANHCGIRAGGLSPASSVTVYWRDQASSCSAGDGDLTHNQSGATLVATDSASDFTLLKLNQSPAASDQVYFAGWDVTGAAARSGSGLHHPQGDVKKVSLFNSPVTATTTSADGATVQAWQVTWAQGVTEQGSSGSGLWDQDHHVIGVLTGGASACAATLPCPTCGPDQPDFYGRLAVAWNNGLKAALDPANTGVTVLCGRNPSAASCSAVTGGIVSTNAGGGNGGGGSMAWASLILLGAAACARRRRRS